MATDRFWESAIPNGASIVDISATDHTCDSKCVGLYVATAGNVKVDMQQATGVVFNSVVAGTLLPGRFTKVWKVGTAASDITELWFRA